MSGRFGPHDWHRGLPARDVAKALDLELVNVLQGALRDLGSAIGHERFERYSAGIEHCADLATQWSREAEAEGRAGAAAALASFSTHLRGVLDARKDGAA